MVKLGLTGGIASGKSAVASMLRELGFPVLDADSISHRLMEPGQPAHNEILREFGPDVTNASGRIDRAKLAAVVFADPDKLARLNAILHPRVEQAMLLQFDAWQRSGFRDAVFVEAALLVEAGFTKDLNGLVVTFCTPAQQLERLLARGMSEVEARRRIAAQLPIDEKLRHATYTIDCSRSLDDTRAQVESLVKKLHKQTTS
jgi:dephospho-CoA kinase